MLSTSHRFLFMYLRDKNIVTVFRIQKPTTLPVFLLESSHSKMSLLAEKGQTAAEPGVSLWYTRGQDLRVTSDRKDSSEIYTSITPIMISPHRVTKENWVSLMSGARGIAATKQSTVTLRRNGDVHVNQMLVYTAAPGLHSLTSINGKLLIDGIVIYPPHLVAVV
jgi:hypothetical protein